MARNFEKERENQRYKECGNFNVALDFVLFKDDSSEWQVSIEWTDGALDTDISCKTYNEALAEYNRWGY
jgi:hypothetical protein